VKKTESQSLSKNIITNMIGKVLRNKRRQKCNDATIKIICPQRNHQNNDLGIPDNNNINNNLAGSFNSNDVSAQNSGNELQSNISDIPPFQNSAVFGTAAVPGFGMKGTKNKRAKHGRKSVMNKLFSLKQIEIDELNNGYGGNGGNGGSGEGKFKNHANNLIGSLSGYFASTIRMVNENLNLNVFGNGNKTNNKSNGIYDNHINQKNNKQTNHQHVFNDQQGTSSSDSSISNQYYSGAAASAGGSGSGSGNSSTKGNVDDI